MSAERDETRIVRSWLEEGVTVLPDRVLDAVLDQLPTTHQRRAVVAGAEVPADEQQHRSLRRRGRRGRPGGIPRDQVPRSEHW